MVFTLRDNWHTPGFGGSNLIEVWTYVVNEFFPWYIAMTFSCGGGMAFGVSKQQEGPVWHMEFIEVKRA